MNKIIRISVLCVILVSLSSDLSFFKDLYKLVYYNIKYNYVAWNENIDNESYSSRTDLVLSEDGREVVTTLPEVDPWPARKVPPRPALLNEGWTFGSSVILERLWMPHELEGSPQDIKIMRLRVPDDSPPVGSIPQPQALPRTPVSHYTIRWVQPVQNRNVMALTFDLCERADDITGYDAPIVNYLRREKVHATFFAGGKWMRSHSEKAMQLMADPLFEVGNHGWTHGNFRVLTGPPLVNQILWTQVQYARLRDELERRARARGIEPSEMDKIPRFPMTFRFPYGTCNAEALQAVSTSGLQAIQWNVVSGDASRHQTAPNIVETVLRQSKPGAIIVFHANGRGHGTSDALPRLIPVLRARGFEFVTVSELLRMGRVITAEECYELRPGDNRKYDAMVGDGTSRWR